MSTISVKKVKLGDNADTSKNFLIEVPAVADGTLTIKRENGTNVLSIGVTGKAVIPGVVGTVAQVGGVPTGQVVERGSNANGEYVRFADGTQICWRILTVSSLAIDQAFYGNFRSATQNWVFPATFVDIPTVVTNALGDSALGSGVGSTLSGSASVFLTSAISVASATRYIGKSAIGRWF